MSSNTKGILGLTSKNRKMLSIGHGNFVHAKRIVSIIEAQSSPMKRLREKALEENLLIDATRGRKMRSVLVLDSKHLVVSSLHTKVLEERMSNDTTPHYSKALQEIQEGEFVS